MALARTTAVALVGVEGHLVDVEADLANGLPSFTLIGLPDTALYEARDRVRAAIVNSGHDWPQRRLTLALSPATLPKGGSGYDLAMAVAILGAAEVVEVSGWRGTAMLGELGLDGSVRPVRGVLPAVAAAVRAGCPQVVVPWANLEEAALVPGAAPIGVDSLGELLALLLGAATARRPGPPGPPPPRPPQPDLADVAGHELARFTLELAAAGGHSVLLEGAPGAGKTMLAERLPSILPPLDRDESLEVTAIHSVAGTLPRDCPLITAPPFQSPHHNASLAALVGGGSGVARPGAISLAHRGVLFLDEAPEFATGVLDALRQPIERGEVEIHRAGAVTRYPSRFQLVLAANPCPCAAAGSSPDCTCTASVRRRYRSRLSGPLLDRIDLQVEVLPPTRADLVVPAGAREQSAVVAARVAAARERTAARLAGTGWRTNAEVPSPALHTRWRLPRPVVADAVAAIERGQLTLRGYDRVLRLAWTIADLRDLPAPGADEVGTALGLRLGRVAA